MFDARLSPSDRPDVDSPTLLAAGSAYLVFGATRPTREAVPDAATARANDGARSGLDPTTDVRRFESGSRPSDLPRVSRAGIGFDEPTGTEPRILEIGGLDPQQARKLVSIGILTCAGLLQRSKTALGRGQIADATGASDETVRAWLGRAELLLIPGIDAAVLRLLESVGVHSVLQLAASRTEFLFEQIALANVQERVLPAWPDVRRVARWIQTARRDARVAPA